MDRLALGRVNDVGAVEPTEVDRLAGCGGDLVEHGRRTRQHGVAVEVGRGDNEGVDAELVDAASRVGLQPTPVDHRAQQRMQAALGDAQPGRQLQLRAGAVCSDLVEEVQSPRCRLDRTGRAGGTDVHLLLHGGRCPPAEPRCPFTEAHVSGVRIHGRCSRSLCVPNYAPCDGACPTRTKPDWYAATTNCARSRRSSLAIARLTWVFTVMGEMTS